MQRRTDRDPFLQFIKTDTVGLSGNIITNQLTASAKTVIANYLLRWGIEQCFRELKDTFYFDHYQLRHIEKIERYWNLCLIAWTLVYWIKQSLSS
jgi:retron-type reverse transcriptase